MSDSEQEKTEAPTQKKRDDAADEGRIPRSQELNAAALLLASAMAINATAPAMGAALRDLMGSGLAYVATAPTLTGEGTVALLRHLGGRTLLAVAGFLGAMVLTALAISGLQARGTFTTKTLAPKFDRVNPMQGFTRIFGKQALVELAKSLLKLAIVGWAIWGVLQAAWPDVMALPQQSPRALLEVMQRYGVKMLTNAGMAYIALAGADYAWQLWQHEESLRMTKEEVKQESKNSEGDPMVKSRQRSIGRQRARQQMFKDVPTADVVVVNPVHIAVALRYDPSVAPAPYVVAVGRRKIAERIKQLAYDAEVPVVENVPLARALVATVKVGTMIPAELYVAVAEVLAFVIRQRSEAGRNAFADRAA